MKTIEQQLIEIRKDLRDTQQIVAALQHAIRLVERRARNAEHHASATTLELANIKRQLRGREG